MIKATLSSALGAFLLFGLASPAFAQQQKDDTPPVAFGDNAEKDDDEDEEKDEDDKDKEKDEDEDGDDTDEDERPAKKSKKH